MRQDLDRIRRENNHTLDLITSEYPVDCLFKKYMLILKDNFVLCSSLNFNHCKTFFISKKELKRSSKGIQ